MSAKKSPALKQIERLLAAGYKVEVRHERIEGSTSTMGPQLPTPREWHGKGNPTPIRAYTEVIIYKGERPSPFDTSKVNVIGHGIAQCSILDQFVRKVGLGIALDRAVRAMNQDFLVEGHEKVTPEGETIAVGPYVKQDVSVH